MPTCTTNSVSAALGDAAMGQFADIAVDTKLVC